MDNKNKTLKIVALVIFVGISGVFVGTELVDKGGTDEAVERKGSISATVVPAEAGNLTAMNSTDRWLRDRELLQEVLDKAVSDGDRGQILGVQAERVEEIGDIVCRAPYHREPVAGHYIRYRDELVVVDTATNDTV
jgi:hypothetical protein